MSLLWSLILALSFHHAVASDQSICPRTLFAFGDGVSDPAALVSNTYLDLFYQLGKGRLTADTLEKLVASGDPFTLPDQADTDLIALQHRLHEFRELVKTKGWDTEPMRAKLLDDVRGLIARQRGLAAIREEALANSFVDYPLGFPENASAEFSPDGRWVVGVEAKHSLITEYFVHDRRTRRTTKQAMPQLPVGRPFFSPDGKELLFPNHTAQLLRVPFENGVGDFTKSVTVGQAMGPMHSLQTYQFMATPGRIYQGRTVNTFGGIPSGDGDPALHRFDLNTNTRIKLKVREYLEDFSIAKWGVVPGTDHLWFLSPRLQPFTLGNNVKPSWNLHVVAVEDDGTIRPVVRPRTWSEGILRDLVWLDDGKTPVVHDQYGLWRWSTLLDAPTQIFPRILVQGRLDTVAQIALHPDGKRAAYLNVLGSNGARIDWLDLKTAEATEGFALPPDAIYRTLKFSPDDGALLLGDKDGNWTVVNHRAR